MLDQVAAVMWVRENIRHFNGDPDQITLFGPGSGAASAGLLALSPLTRPFIKRVIASSGSAVADWATLKDYILIRNNSIVAGYFYGCRTFHTHKLVECLKSRSYTDVSLSTVKPDVGWTPWAPVPDFATRPRELQFMPEIPEVMLDRGMTFAPGFAYLTGLTRDEGAAMLLEDDELIASGYMVDRKYFDKKVRDFVKVYNATLNPTAFQQAIQFMYTPYTDITNDTLIREGVVDVSLSRNAVSQLTTRLRNTDAVRLVVRGRRRQNGQVAAEEPCQNVHVRVELHDRRSELARMAR